MEYIYNTENVCARRIKVEINGDIVSNVEFLDGGCNGNLKAVRAAYEESQKAV